MSTSPDFEKKASAIRRIHELISYLRSKGYTGKQLNKRLASTLELAGEGSYLPIFYASTKEYLHRNDNKQSDIIVDGIVTIPNEVLDDKSLLKNLKESSCNRIYGKYKNTCTRDVSKLLSTEPKDCDRIRKCLEERLYYTEHCIDENKRDDKHDLIVSKLKERLTGCPSSSSSKLSKFSDYFPTDSNHSNLLNAKEFSYLRNISPPSQKKVEIEEDPELPPVIIQSVIIPEDKKKINREKEQAIMQEKEKLCLDITQGLYETFSSSEDIFDTFLMQYNKNKCITLSGMKYWKHKQEFATLDKKSDDYFQELHKKLLSDRGRYDNIQIQLRHKMIRMVLMSIYAEPKNDKILNFAQRMLSSNILTPLDRLIIIDILFAFFYNADSLWEFLRVYYICAKLYDSIPVELKYFVTYLYGKKGAKLYKDLNISDFGIFADIVAFGNATSSWLKVDNNLSMEEKYKIFIQSFKYGNPQSVCVIIPNTYGKVHNFQDILFYDVLFYQKLCTENKHELYQSHSISGDFNEFLKFVHNPKKHWSSELVILYRKLLNMAFVARTLLPRRVVNKNEFKGKDLDFLIRECLESL